MTTELGLAQDFLALYPDSAARVLEHLPVEDSAAFLGTLDAAQLIAVYRHLLPAVAARCLTALPQTVNRQLLRGLGPQSAAIILRHMDGQSRETILQQLGTTQAYAIRHLISYPEDTVGAWMHTEALAFAPDTTISEVLDEVRRSQGDDQHRVYVVTRDHHLLGYVTLSELLRLPPQQTLAHHHHPATQLLPARALLRTLRHHPAWRGATDLPVIEHDGRFVGMLAHTTLTRALDQQHTQAPGIALGSLLEAAVSGYWIGMQGLLHALAGLARHAVGKHDREH